MNTIDSKEFFQDLSAKPFSLTLSDEEQNCLTSGIAYWKKTFSEDEDLRKLALVLSKIHRGKPPLTNDRNRLTLTKEQLDAYFRVTKADWISVKHTTGEING